MGYYGRRRYRTWRSRGWGGSSGPSKYSALSGLFGDAVTQIRKAFLELDDDALDELFLDYGAMHGDSPEKYARNTFHKWKSGATKLSGQTMERLMELVPPYLSQDQRFSILKLVLTKHQRYAPHRSIKINVKEPGEGFTELERILATMTQRDLLAHLPEKVMKAASWLYDDDITAARSMLAEADRIENEQIRARARREIELLKRTISTGQVKAATYTVQMPAGTLSVTAFTPSLCFVATVCFGTDAPETIALRAWRDKFLVKHALGREFIVWYYKNGEVIAEFVDKSKLLKQATKLLIGAFASFIIKIKRYSK